MDRSQIRLLQQKNYVWVGIGTAVRPLHLQALESFLFVEGLSAMLTGTARE